MRQFVNHNKTENPVWSLFTFTACKTQYGSLYKRGKSLLKHHLLWHLTGKKSYRVIKPPPFSLLIYNLSFKTWKQKNQEKMICRYATSAFGRQTHLKVVTGLSFMIMEQGMCVSCLLMCHRGTIIAGLGKSLGLTTNIHNLPCLGKRMGSQLRKRLILNIPSLFLGLLVLFLFNLPDSSCPLSANPLCFSW